LYGVVDFMCGFHYDLSSRRFKNTEYEDVVYGWEEKPTQGSMSFSDAPQTQETPMHGDWNYRGNNPTDDMPFGSTIDDSEAPF
jgi:hypothetical protein